jgi:MSHA biogenesis protein MshE
VEPTPQQSAWMARQLGPKQPKGTQFYEGIGCTYCNMTGYRGRIGIYELLEIDSPIADAIRRRDLAQVGKLAQSQPGFVPLVRRALAYAAEGVTSISETTRVTSGLDENESSAALLRDVLSSEDRLRGSI